MVHDKMESPEKSPLQAPQSVASQAINKIEVELESFGEAVANGITHGLGLILSIIGLVVLVGAAAAQDDITKIVSSILYGVSLIAMYSSSTLYHSFQYPKLRYYLRILDHTSIYLLIAGTYTPFTLVSLRGVWGWSLFAAVWGLAFIGITFKLIFEHRYHVVSVVIYLVMGWMGVVAIKPVMEVLPPTALLWLLAGGIAYTGGIVFYIWKKPYSHTIWHLFVLAGSLCHYIAVLLYVIK